MPRFVLLLAPIVLAGSPGTTAGTEIASPPKPALSGIAAGPDGALFVSPAPGEPAVIHELDLTGAPGRSFPIPGGRFVQVADVDVAGRPVCIEPESGRLFVLGESNPVSTIRLADLPGFDPRAVSPLVRAAPDGELATITLDGTKVLRIPPVGAPRVVPLADRGAGPAADFDVATDGRFAVLGAQTDRLWLYDANGRRISETAAVSDARPDNVPAAVRFSPDGTELWVLELPPPEDPDRQTVALQRYDATLKRLSRLERLGDGSPIPPVAGFALTVDGAWLADLDGEAWRIDRAGAVRARFNAAPPPPGMSWDDKRRLERIAAAPQGAPLAEVVGALAATRARRNTDQLWERLTADTAASAPLLRDAVAARTLDGPVFATFLATGWPATRDRLAAALKDPSQEVRNAAVAVLRSPAVTGFDAELAAATNDPAPPVRASALVVLTRNRWTPAALPLLRKRLSDADPAVAELAAGLLAQRLPETVSTLAAVVKETTAKERTRVLAARAILLDLPDVRGLPPLPADARGPLRSLAQSADAKIRRVGALALVVHRDPSAPAAIERAWSGLPDDQKRVALEAWSPELGPTAGPALERLLAKEKNRALRDGLLRALSVSAGSRATLIRIATAKGDERDRVVALELAARRLSDEQIAGLGGELPTAGPDLRKAIARLIAARGVDTAAPALAGLATSDADRIEALAALLRLGNAAAAATASERVLARAADADTALAYLATVGGVPADALPRFREIARDRGPDAVPAAEALARSGDVDAIPVLVEASRADGSAAGPQRDAALPGALAAAGEAGRVAARSLLAEKAAAAREVGVLALALKGGDACREVVAWGTGRGADGVVTPSAFYALAACDDVRGAVELYRTRAESTATGDVGPRTAQPPVFAALLALLLNHPDFRPKAEPVLDAVSQLPRPVVEQVARAIAGDLHPAVAVPAVKFVF